MKSLIDGHEIILMKHLIRATEGGRLLWLPIPDVRMCHINNGHFGTASYLVLEEQEGDQLLVSIRVQFPDGLTVTVFDRMMSVVKNEKASLVYDRLMEAIDASQRNLADAAVHSISTKIMEASSCAEPNETYNEDYPDQMNDWLWKESDPRQ